MTRSITPNVTNRAVCGGCAFEGPAVTRGRIAVCPICAVEIVEALAAKAQARVSHTAILMGQQFLLRGGQSLKGALISLRERLGSIQ